MRNSWQTPQRRPQAMSQEAILPGLVPTAGGVQELLDADPRLLVREQEEDSVWRVTPLHYAVTGGHGGLAVWLIEQGARVAPYTRLLCNAAVRMGHPELVSVLLDGGADRELARVWARP